jgi:hypothetical protein
MSSTRLNINAVDVVADEVQKHPTLVGSVATGMAVFFTRVLRRRRAASHPECVDETARQEIQALRQDLFNERTNVAREEGSTSARMKTVEAGLEEVKVGLRDVAKEQAEGNKVLYRIAGRMDVPTD